MVEQLLKSFRLYVYAVVKLLIDPKLFFTQLANNATFLNSFGFCFICSLFFTAANLLTGEYAKPINMGFIFFFNSISTIFISSGLSYIVMVMFFGKRASFELIFNIYAFSSGIVFLISWMSFFLWFTEPWKWWLVYTGLRNSCKFQWKSALLILLSTVIVQFFLMYSLYLAFSK